MPNIDNEFYQIPIGKLCPNICLDKPLGEMINESTNVIFKRNLKTTQVQFVYEGDQYTLTFKRPNRKGGNNDVEENQDGTGEDN